MQRWKAHYRMVTFLLHIAGLTFLWMFTGNVGQWVFEYAQITANAAHDQVDATTLLTLDSGMFIGVTAWLMLAGCLFIYTVYSIRSLIRELAEVA